jgi:hypothetical protein
MDALLGSNIKLGACLLEFGNATSLPAEFEQGSWVYVIGSPFNLSSELYLIV